MAEHAQIDHSPTYEAEREPCEECDFGRLSVLRLRKRSIFASRELLASVSLRSLARVLLSIREALGSEESRRCSTAAIAAVLTRADHNSALAVLHVRARAVDRGSTLGLRNACQ